MREEKKSEVIQDALNYLDDDMIEEVDILRGGVSFEKNRNVVKQMISWRKWISFAAGICILIIVGGIWYGIEAERAFDLQENVSSDKNGLVESAPLNDAVNNKEDAEAEKDIIDKDFIDTDAVVDGDDTMYQESQRESVTLPAYQVNLEKNDDLASDMALFFIYEGRCYVQTCDYMSKAVIGKYVCTTTGLIDEWNEKDGYVELAGSIEADIFTVAGVDPEFMLCTVYDDGIVETFVHNNGISLSRGGEILELLGFKVGMEEYTSFCNKGNSCTTEVSEEAKEILDKFFANFAENEVMLRKDISIITNEEEIYHLVIVTQGEVPLHFELLNGGYVSYYGLQEVCVKIDKRVYELVVDVLEGR